MKHSERIMQYISTRDWQGMSRMLDSLSNMEFRLMEHAVRSSVLPHLDNDLFWESLLHLIIYKRPAFIAGVTSCEHLVKANTLDFTNESIKALSQHLSATNPESLKKIANMLLPILKSEAQVQAMFTAFHLDDEIARIGSLLKVDTPLSYYLIFKSLKMLDDRVIARKCCTVIMKRNNDMAFNAVSLIKTYWAIDDLPARFSLNIEEYELSFIDRNFANFERILNGKRPVL